MKGKSLKKRGKQLASDNATMAMPVPGRACGTNGCLSEPAWSVGTLLFCTACLEATRTTYPNSFAAYWEPKLRPLE